MQYFVLSSFPAGCYLETFSRGIVSYILWISCHLLLVKWLNNIGVQRCIWLHFSYKENGLFVFRYVKSDEWSHESGCSQSMNSTKLRVFWVPDGAGIRRGRLFEARLALTQNYQIISSSGFIYFGWKIQLRPHRLEPFCIYTRNLLKKIPTFLSSMIGKLSSKLSLILD